MSRRKTLGSILRATNFASSFHYWDRIPNSRSRKWSLIKAEVKFTISNTNNDPYSISPTEVRICVFRTRKQLVSSSRFRTGVVIRTRFLVFVRGCPGTKTDPKLLCLPVFDAKLINIFVFFVFILVDTFSGSIKTEKSQKNPFTLTENNFGERKLSCTCLNFG